MLLAICVGGVGLVTYSRYERLHPVTAASKSTVTVPPTKANMWEVGLDLDICGKTKQLPATNSTTEAFTTNGHGVVTIEPARASDPTAYSGKNATLESFLLPAGVILSSNKLQIPGTPKATTTTTTTTPSSTTTTTTSASSSSTTSSTSSTSTTTTTVPAPKPLVYTNGDKCNGKPAEVQVEEWKSPSAKSGTVLKTPTSLLFKDGQLITIAFVPKGTTIPKPTSAKQIADFLISNPTGLAPADVGTNTASTTTTPTTTAGSATTTTSPSTTTTSKAPKKKSS